MGCVPEGWECVPFGHCKTAITRQSRVENNEWGSQRCVKVILTGKDVLAGARGAVIDGQEKPGRADLFELSLLTRIKEDHG